MFPVCARGLSHAHRDLSPHAAHFGPNSGAYGKPSSAHTRGLRTLKKAPVKKPDAATATPAAEPAPKNKGGRPKLPQHSRSAGKQAALIAALELAEGELAAAQSTCKTDRSVRAALLQTQAEMAVASAWATLCRAQGNLTHAIKMQELVVKLGRIDAAQRELLATDDLADLKERARKEDALT